MAFPTWGIVLLALAAVYLVLWLLLFFFPGILHTPRDFPISRRILNAKSMATFSHRGGQKEFFENSMSAFRHSIKLGIFGLELDVHRTRCGNLVIAHDHSLLRSTGQDVLIKDIDYGDIGHYMPIIQDAWNELEDDFAHLPPERPPLLEELFRLVEKENVMMSIDLKSNDPNDFERILRMIYQYNLQNKVVVGGFSSKQCKERMKKLNLKLPMFFDVRDCIFFFISTLFWLLPFVPFHNDWLMIPHGFRNFTSSAMYKRHWGVKLVACMFWIEKWYFRIIVWHMNRRGVPVVFWVLNCEEDWDLGIRMGANGLMTDYPSRLKSYLEEKGMFGHIRI